MRSNRITPRRTPGLLALWTLFTFLGTSIFIVIAAHEILGHGLVCRLAGGRVSGYQVGIFHGQAGVWGYPVRGCAPYAVHLGGIAVTLVLGGAALALARGTRPDSAARVFLLILGAMGLASGLGYLGLGSIVDRGDPTVIDLPGGRLARALTLGPVGLVGVAWVLLALHRRLVVCLGGPGGDRRADRVVFGIACYVPALVALAALEVALKTVYGGGLNDWLYVKLAAVPLAGVALPAADALLPGARPGGAAGSPFNARHAVLGGIAYALVLAVLLGGLYAGYDA